MPSIFQSFRHLAGENRMDPEPDLSILIALFGLQTTFTLPSFLGNQAG